MGMLTSRLAVSNVEFLLGKGFCKFADVVDINVIEV